MRQINKINGEKIIMTALKPLCRLIGINPRRLSKEEHGLLEAALLIRICKEIKEVFREQHKEYFCLMKFTKEKEKIMIDANFIRLIIQDILSTEEYTLQGIAYYTDTNQDVVEEVATGLNISPSATFLQRVIELHQSVRHDLYNVIIKKIATEYLAVA